MEKFTIPCDRDGQKSSIDIAVGEPCSKRHPLHYQAQWLLTSERRGTIPPEVMDGFQKLHEIAKENGISFEELCVYALGTASREDIQES